MFNALRNLFKSGPTPPQPAVPDGTRYYVIGDIHGRRDLFDAMIEEIESDDEHRPDMETHVILLGDLIDRGPDSAGVVAKAREWQKQRSVRTAPRTRVYMCDLRATLPRTAPPVMPSDAARLSCC